MNQTNTKFFFNDNFLNEMIIEKKFKKALLEKKISQQLNGKNVTEIKTSIFPSSKEIKEINLKESLKNTGVLSPETEEHLTVRKLPKNIR